MELDELPLTFGGQFGGREREPEMIEMKIIPTEAEGSEDEDPTLKLISNFDDDFPLKGRSPQQQQHRPQQQQQQQPQYYEEEEDESEADMNQQSLHEALRTLQSFGLRPQSTEDNTNDLDDDDITNYVEAQQQDVNPYQYGLIRDEHQYDGDDGSSSSQGECGENGLGLTAY